MSLTCYSIPSPIHACQKKKNESRQAGRKNKNWLTARGQTVIVLKFYDDRGSAGLHMENDTRPNARNNVFFARLQT